ncbi:MAG TPA: undecaprenyl-diphosphate phosphatase [Conexivisphaerales archaeon]|nr:undecaprenyl-diphosphate phosphatase [Conexivisphaerales archaeon]
MANWLLGVILGLVQGISEWLPISSKTQIIIVSTYLFGLDFKQAYSLGLFLEAGTFLAALFYFRREVLDVLKALVGRGSQEGRILLKFLLVVTTITGLVGVGLFLLVSETATTPAIGVPMVILGVVLLADAALIRYAKNRKAPSRGIMDLTLKDDVLIGIAQGLSALPGVSRSGVTVSAMLLLGLKPEDSFKLSFLALIPASVGAAGVSVLFSDVGLSSVVSAVTVPVIAVAILVAMLVSMVFIRVLLRVAASSRITVLVAALGILAILSGITSILSGFG